MPRSRTRRRPVASDRRFRRVQNGADYGPHERWQHAGRTLEATETAGLLAARVTEEHSVDILVMRGVITASQRDAALKFKRDFHAAALAARVCSSYSATPGLRESSPRERERSDGEEAAYRRWRNATRELGPRLSGPMLSVICQDMTPLPRDIVALQAGLEKLVRWYGLPKD